MDFYSAKAPSYCDAVSSKGLYRTMIWMYLNFYIISFLCWPLRTLAVLSKAVFAGKEETRYAKWFIDRIHVRRKWRKLARDAG